VFNHSKPKIHEALVRHIKKQHDELQTMISSVQDSVNSDQKSSAGDKHETSRAMGHLEIERLSNRISELSADFKKLQILDPNVKCSLVQFGALVSFPNKIIYISVASGKFLLEEHEYIAISANAPIARELLGKKQGDKIKMAQQLSEILAVE